MSFGRSIDAVPASTDARLRTAVVGLTGAAAVALAGRLLATVLVNAPNGTSRAPVTGLATAGTVLAALALVAAGATDGSPVAGVGLLFAGVFGLLSVVAPAATLPAAVAVTAGTALSVGGRRSVLDGPTGVVAGLFVVALGVGLASGVVGIAATRGLASSLALVAVGLTPAFAAAGPGDLLGGAGAFTVVVAVGLAVPFVTGAVTLVSLGAVGTAMPVVALAVAGAVTTASAAVRERRWLLLAGLVLVAVAGIPATLDRALPFALGLATLLEGQR
ncbi:phosphate ABC transporter permease [Haloarcula salinisoli]|uniref:Phosphate ABC transporter permease n=1 Tax=Haloarcula salinisoli TaxID=2487746 RepID=A0A8J7YB16_9EURY|nr:phosphate ABC transporter permease [Halomicroarcula salinisoli]MBX0286360.1 phosphate ABC transporter permease [Halomicroarcula salinisoli]MBX0302152.1 phosphate ABC transporter permease [Halomicroarcula salinisoli]